MSKEVLIIGGGASGMMAAITAAQKGHEVTIFEKNEKLGKKILVTGNGRCNITNTNVSWKNYHGTNPKFSASVLAQFDNDKTVEFFERLGLVLVEEDKGRLFPRSNQAQSVIDLLEQELDKLDIKVLFNRKVKQLTIRNKRFFVTTYQKKKYEGDALILATGGRTFPKTGSTGDGYRFAESFGHNIIKPFPASTPFRIKSIVCNKLQGIKVNVRLKVYSNSNLISDKTGELLFTHLGVSAPVVLESSRAVSKVLSENRDANIICSINFFPEYSQEELHKLLKRRIVNHPERNISSQFTGILPKKVTPTILRDSKIDPEQISKQVSSKTIHQILQSLTDYRLSITGVLDWNIAQFTAGGVDTKEIDSKTMQSKLVPDLYFCGEVVDIDGDSGGYNLQWAWSSGYVAGNNIL
ncbi:NAD(P)/FAD-dependent oxidoreductase [Patescibacteria group bacterium]